MYTYTLVTGNTSKAKEMRRFLGQVDIVDFDLPEIQETDPEKVIEAKLIEARKHAPITYIVEDTSLVISHLNGLPGPLIKWFQKTIGNSGIYNLAVKCTDCTAFAQTTIGYISELGEMSFYTGKINGKIVAERGTNGFGWDAIFQPDGDNKTFGEMTPKEKDVYSMRRIACEKLITGLGRDKN